MITQIRNALMAHMATFSGVPIVWPAQPVPAQSGEFLRVDFMPNQTGWPFINNDGSLDYMGLVQVMAHVKPGANAAARATELADMVAAHFPRGLSLDLEDNGRVTIYRPPYQSAPLVDGDWLAVPVTVQYRALI